MKSRYALFWVLIALGSNLGHVRAKTVDQVVPFTQPDGNALTGQVEGKWEAQLDSEVHLQVELSEDSRFELAMTFSLDSYYDSLQDSLLEPFQLIVVFRGTWETISDSLRLNPDPSVELWINRQAAVEYGEKLTSDLPNAVQDEVTADIVEDLMRGLVDPPRVLVVAYELSWDGDPLIMTGEDWGVVLDLKMDTAVAERSWGQIKKGRFAVLR